MSFVDLLNIEVDLTRDMPTPDGYGGFTTEPSIVDTLKARISPIGARERVAGDKIWSAATHKVFMEAETIPLDTDRIVYDGRSFNILGVVNPSEMSHHIEVLVEEST